MSVAQTLLSFQTKSAHCSELIVAAHHEDSLGALAFTVQVREQMVKAAFLNFFVAWETFLEETTIEFFMGQPSLTGSYITKFVSPQSRESAASIIICPGNRFFNWGDHDRVRNLSKLFFHLGQPFEQHISSIISELQDSRTIRNATAHVSSSTQRALETLALHIFGQPRSGISAHDLLLNLDPRLNGTDTVFSYYQQKLLLAAELIARG